MLAIRIARLSQKRHAASNLPRVCAFSNNGASDCGRMVNDADCGRDAPAPQCPWFAMRPQSQAENAQTLAARSTHDASK